MKINEIIITYYLLILLQYYRYTIYTMSQIFSKIKMFFVNTRWNNDFLSGWILVNQFCAIYLFSKNVNNSQLDPAFDAPTSPILMLLQLNNDRINFFLILKSYFKLKIRN